SSVVPSPVAPWLRTLNVRPALRASDRAGVSAVAAMVIKRRPERSNAFCMSDFIPVGCEFATRYERAGGDRRSGDMRALRLDINRINRLARGHEKVIALLAAKAEVRADLGKQNHADALAVWRENMRAIVTVTHPARG